MTGHLPMPAGTPQGSVLSPILFDLFLVDIPTSEFVKTVQFADDTSAYATSESAGRIQCEMNAHLARLHEYFDIWKLQLNADKSELCVFTGFVRETGRAIRRQFRSLSIAIRGRLLEPRKHIKLLGVTFQSNGRFCRHVDAVLTKARGAYGALRPVLRSRLIEPRLRVGVYKAYVRPIITYAAPIWVRPVFSSSHQMERLRRFERGILRTAGQIHRARGDFLYARNADLHRAVNCERIDKFMVGNSLKFVDRCLEAENPKLSGIVQQRPGGFFPDINNLWNADQADVLLENDRLTLFDTAYNGSGRRIYNRGDC